MSYEHREEIEMNFGDHEFTLELICDVEMISPGRPQTGPSYSSAGEPAEGPEFECQDMYLSFNDQKIPDMKMPLLVLDIILGEDFMEAFVERACEKASENWDPSDE